MAVTKPNLIMSGASMYGVKRARDGASGRSMAQNAALGLDNFSRLLRSEPSAARDFMPQGQGAGVAANAELMKAAGLENAQPVSQMLPGLTPVMPGVTPGASLPQGLMPEHNLRDMSALQKALQANAKPLATASGLRSLENARMMGGDAAALSLKSAIHKVKDAAKTAVEAVAGSLGKLSSLFESGREGVAAIGYDQMGGTSYGAYQIASNTGSFDEFLKYLDKHAPDYSKELRKAGDPNSGGKSGAVPDAWRAIAARDPDGFGALQHGFIEQNLYEPAAKSLGDQGIDETRLSPVMREVLFSTAVQHGAGGAARIVGRAMQGVKLQDLLADEGAPGAKNKAEEMAIRRIYDIRQQQFGSSTPYVQQAVSNRLNSEMQVALNMLKTGEVG